MARAALTIRHAVTAWLGGVLLAAIIAAGGPAAALEDESLVQSLREGGYTIYFRHAATNWDQADRVREAGDWTSCDPEKMRQLSDKGRATARRIGEAIRALEIPVGRVLSSEYCRAAETAQSLGLDPVQTTPDIMNMRAAELVGGREAVIRRARRVIAEPPPEGTNTIIVGHGNLMRAATGAYTSEGGSGIYAPRPENERGFALVAELAPRDWVRLADRWGSSTD